MYSILRALYVKRQNKAHNCPKLRELEYALRNTTLRICVKRDRTIPANVPNYVNWNSTNLLYAPLRTCLSAQLLLCSLPA